MTSTTTTEEYHLKERRPGCSGMFWRADPTGATAALESKDDWPRNGAMVRGTKVDHEGLPWLLVTHVKQADDKDWKAAPKGAALPFEYDNHYYLEQ
jgi:hypothetical protein